MSVPPRKSSQTHGYLAILKLCQLVGVDCTLTPAVRRAFMILAGFSGPDGSLFPSMATCGNLLGISSEAFGKSVRKLRDRGYLSLNPFFDPKTGARRANLIIMNFDMVRLYADNPIALGNNTLNSKSIVSLKPKSCEGTNTNEVIGGSTTKVAGGPTTEVVGGRTPAGSSKRTIKKSSKEIIEEIKVRAAATQESLNLERLQKLNYTGWLQEKNYEVDTGITKDMKHDLNELIIDVTKNMSRYQRNKLSFEAQGAAKSVPKDQSYQAYWNVYQKRKSQLEGS